MDNNTRLNYIQHILYPRREGEPGGFRRRQLSLEERQTMDVKRNNKLSLRDEEKGILRKTQSQLYKETSEWLRKNG